MTTQPIELIDPGLEWVNERHGKTDNIIVLHTSPFTWAAWYMDNPGLWVKSHIPWLVKLKLKRKKPKEDLISKAADQIMEAFDSQIKTHHALGRNFTFQVDEQIDKIAVDTDRIQKIMSDIDRHKADLERQQHEIKKLRKYTNDIEFQHKIASEILDDEFGHSATVMGDIMPVYVTGIRSEVNKPAVMTMSDGSEKKWYPPTSKFQIPDGKLESTPVQDNAQLQDLGALAFRMLLIMAQTAIGIIVMRNTGMM